ncbi:hypothetical protein, partial [Bacillus wiedmannii]|uniref:hypothetical protein n=1 Tax=Bacillus wiedmannii TaxID=1890302 RepID=UPI0015CF5346
RVVFFENPLFCPCMVEFGGNWDIAKPNRPKTGYRIVRLGLAIIPAEPPVLSFQKISLLPIHLREVPGG